VKDRTLISKIFLRYLAKMMKKMRLLLNLSISCHMHRKHGAGMHFPSFEINPGNLKLFRY